MIEEFLPKQLDDDEVEAAIGRDLQFIRINGTIVGGLVGMTLHFIVGWI